MVVGLFAEFVVTEILAMAGFGGSAPVGMTDVADRLFGLCAVSLFEPIVKSDRYLLFQLPSGDWKIWVNGTLSPRRARLAIAQGIVDWYLRTSEGLRLTLSERADVMSQASMALVMPSEAVYAFAAAHEPLTYQRACDVFEVEPSVAMARMAGILARDPDSGVFAIADYAGASNENPISERYQAAQ